MRIGKIFCLSLLVYGCTVTNKIEKDNPIVLQVKEIESGICKTNLLYYEKSDDSPSGNRSISKGFKLIKQTDKIPGKIGLKFGVEFIIKSSNQACLPIERVWIFPSTIINDKGLKFKELRYFHDTPLNKKSFATYTLEKEFEIVKGEWIYQMFYNGIKVYEKKFYIID